MAKSNEDTPLLKQYFSIKAQHPEAILLYRVGDFYETYSDDAVLTSKLIGLVQTRRSNGDKGDVPMAGFPHHALDTYLPKLVSLGYKVAICDQLEDPATAKTKLVQRGVTEIVTPGVAFGEAMLTQKEHNYLAGLCFNGDSVGVAFLDVSTGTFQLSQGTQEFVRTLMSSLAPKEVVVQRESVREVREWLGDVYISTLDEWAFVPEATEEKLCNQLGVRSLKGFAVDRYPLAVCSAGALIFYLEQTHHTGLKNICSISRIDADRFVWMDGFTLRNLEVFSSNAGKEGVCLVDVLDRCCTAMGSRLLRQWLSMPSLDLKDLEARQDVVQSFVGNEDALEDLRSLLSQVGDMERSLSRAATGRILPRELLQLGRGLSQMEPVSQLCASQECPSGALGALVGRLDACKELIQNIFSTLAESPAAQVGKGPVIAAGVDEELDYLRGIASGGKDELLKMQQREVEKTGINSLKIGYNSVFGYYIEVRNTFRDKVPPEWVRKQTLVSAERYVTEELKQYEVQINSAESTILAKETAIYADLVAKVQASIRKIQTNCAIIARLDVLQGFARQALDRNYCRPVIDKSNVLDIKAGRHPVLETLMRPGEEYVPNDLFLDSSGEQVMILTGPNMAGKSALLRQTALIVLMAQTGSFVPADSVRMGYFDKIFTRVGASDNISRGESTFMVEMLETSMIMHNLSQRSLVLLDEIGRGTSTYDGMSIARALVQYICVYGKGAKTLFATHYHELNDLETQYSKVSNYHIAVKEEGHDIIFLRKLCKGGVAHSFGIHVARLAGMPREIVESAERTLRNLERREKQAVALEKDSSDDGTLQLSLFQLDDPTLASLKSRLQEADLNNMTPLQALDLLRAMKQELGLK